MAYQHYTHVDINGFSSLNVGNAAQRRVKGFSLQADLGIPVTQEEVDDE